ncbi:MAG: sulfotransferase domain-containing protein [Gemmatimonadales bacterium]|nr:sulfotransferase domain-containing protein [Gemmatimonadales bacterium]MBA3553156.1 sulfotransferase domain-containing protein [Gemmatimonadales bacterium]
MKAPLRRLRGDYRTLTAPFRALPSALIIGAQKAGTTSLFNYLVRHPDVLPPRGKEIHYFDLHYDRGVRWYRGRFPYEYRLRGGALTLDASPYYMVHPLAPERAARLLPDAKLVALLRNPVDRAFSHFQHEVRGGRETLSFDEAIEKETERLAGEEVRLGADPGYYSFNHHRYSYVRRGQYVDQLRRWVEHFPRSRLLVLQSEWLFRDPAAATGAVQEFLGLSRHREGTYRPFLQGKYDREMAPGVRQRLVTHFEPYNRELYRWLGDEFDWSA